MENILKAYAKVTVAAYLETEAERLISGKAYPPRNRESSRTVPKSILISLNLGNK